MAKQVCVMIASRIEFLFILGGLRWGVFGVLLLFLR